MILETEEPELRSWQTIYADHGVTLPLERWLATLGTDGSDFDPYADLEARAGRPLDRADLRARRRALHRERIRDAPPLPGVLSWLREARELGLATAVASSSPRSWVAGHLERLGLLERFERLHCREDVVLAKPAPDLYLAAARAAAASPADCIAVEDSPNGVLAARRAGCYTVAVPSPLIASAGLPLEGADLRLGSLAEAPLRAVLARARFRSQGGGTAPPVASG